MALTYDVVTEYTHRGVLRAVYEVETRGRSLPFDKQYVAPDTYGNRYLWPGMIVAMNSTRSMWVPWSAAGSYGAYSTYAMGIVDDMFDGTMQYPILAPAVHCRAIEAHCYVYGSAVGTIPAAVKEASGHNFEMRLVQWDSN